jgi:hypothetical protein
MNTPFDKPTPPEGTNIHRILSLGAGVQSTCLYLLIMHGLVDPIEAAVFADTGDEPDEVYRHLEWMKSLGGPRIDVVRQAETSLGDSLIHGINSTGGRFASIPAFIDSGSSGGGIGRRQCTKEWKLTPIERWIKRVVLGLAPRKHVPKSQHVIQLIGISLDESARAIRVMRNNTDRWCSVEFPLIQRKWTRSDCLNWMKENGYPTPPRSACVFCPYKTDSEWLRLKTKHPKEWARAVEIDHAIRTPTSRQAKGMRSKVYLHRARIPLDEVDFEGRIDAATPDGEQLGFWQECQGMCGM